jgi:AAA ATPase-like protein
MQKLAIARFAGLENVTFELRPLTVFIGPQATGKSVVAKLAYFFRGLPMAMLDAVQEGSNWEQFVESTKLRFLSFFPPAAWGTQGIEIEHATDGKTVTVRRKTGRGTMSDEPEIHLTFAKTYRDVFDTIRREFPHITDRGAAEETAVGPLRPTFEWQRRAEHHVQEQFDSNAKFDQIFVTAARAFFSQAKATVFTQLREGGALDPFLVEFGAFLEQTRSVLRRRGFFGGKTATRVPFRISKKDLEYLHSALVAILRGKLVRRDTGEAIQTSDGRVIPISMASSGQQESLPLLLLLARFFLVPHRLGRSIYVEEPEAHLFPSAQREVVELLVETFNRRMNGMEIILTTHSPYILTSLNNLLKAGQRYSEGDEALERKLAKIVPKIRALAPEHLAAYALENGGGKSIVDDETGLLDPAAIDRVSEILAEEFHNLLWEGR